MLTILSNVWCDPHAVCRQRWRCEHCSVLWPLDGCIVGDALQCRTHNQIWNFNPYLTCMHPPTSAPRHTQQSKPFSDQHISICQTQTTPTKVLPPQIRVQAFMRAPRSFNAKNQCTGRRYQYLAPSYAFSPKGELTEVRVFLSGWLPGCRHVHCGHR